MATGDKLVTLDEIKEIYKHPLVVTIPAGQWSGSGSDYYISVTASNVTADSILVPTCDRTSEGLLKGSVWCVPAAGSFTIHTSAIPAGTVTIMVQFIGTLGEAQYQVLADVYSKSQTYSKTEAVAKADIINNLTSTATDQPLSAAQGKALNTAIAQSTAVETISQSNYITLSDGIQIEKWDGVKKCGKIIQASFVISKTDGTSFGSYTSIGSINNPYRPSVRFVEPVSIANSMSSAVQINGNFVVTTGGTIAIYATASNSNVVYVSMTYMIN